MTGYRDTIKQALEAAEKGDTETLLKLTKQLNEINESAKEIAEEVRK